MIRDADLWLTPDREEDRFLPEGPRAIILGGREAVAWVNIQTAPHATVGTVFVRYWDTGEVRRFDLPDRPGFILPTDRPDTLLVGMGKRLVLFRPLTGDIEELATIADDSPRTIINDGEVATGGEAVVFGTKDVKFADPIANLYRYDLTDRKLTMLADGMTCSNGKVFTHGTDGHTTLVDIDTPRKRVDQYVLDLAGRIVGVRSGIDVQSLPGFPDGMVDAGDGTVIIAFYNPEPVTHGLAKRFRLADGAVLDEWRIPGSPRVTCPLLVRRPDGMKLILTTAVEGVPADQRVSCPKAGSLFIAAADGLKPPAAEVLHVNATP